MSLKHTLTIIALFLCSGFLAASQPYSPKVIKPLSESWRWKNFPELEGKGVRQIAESKNQTVWVSCNEGVLEYDGFSWKQHRELDTLINAPAEQLLSTSEGHIFVTSSTGIFKYDGEKWHTFFDIPDQLPFTFHHISQLRDQSIIACSDWGITHFREGRIIFYTSAAKQEQLKNSFTGLQWVILPEVVLSSSGSFLNASDVMLANDGSMWFALTIEAEMGTLLKFDPSSVDGEEILDYEAFTSEEGFKMGEQQKMLQAQNGKIWIINSTSNKGVFTYDGAQWETIYLNNKFGGDQYMVSIIESEDGTIWIGSMARVFAFKNGRWQAYRAPSYPVPANRIILQNSKAGHIWVAGYKSKVLLLDYSTDQYLSYDGLSFQCEVTSDEQWFLEVDNRVVRRRGNEWIAYDTSDGLMDAPVKLIHTSRGQVWVAGSHNGVAATALFRNGKWEKHIHRNLSWSFDYRSVFEAQDGTLWFGSAVDAELADGFYSGILELPDPTDENLDWIHHRFNENGLNQASNYGIGQSKDGRIWIGGTKLMYYDGQQWNSLPQERLNQYVNIVTSTDELLLVGSRYYGVFIYDGKEWTNYNTSHGLSGNTIIDIEAVSDSCIYVATENDICRFEGTTWTKNIFPERFNMDFEGGTITCTPDNNIWISHVPRSWKRRAYQSSGSHIEQWEFFSTRYHPTDSPPETYFDFFQETVSPKGNCLISWKGQDFFGATPVGSLTYSYRIDGGAWSGFTQKNQHTFTSLPSGMHHLEVRARDLDFNIDPSPALITFKVANPIWKQAWFILLLLVFLLIFGIYEYRVISKKQKLEVLNKDLKETNKELKASQKQIEDQNQAILSQQEKILEQSKALEFNNKNLEERNQEIRKQKDKLEDMVVQVERLSKAKIGFFTNISHELRTPLTLILGPIEQLNREGQQVEAAERQKLYGIIQRNASRLLKLINQLLEIRRIEQSSLELNFTEVQLSAYVTEVLQLFENLAIQRDIYLDFSAKCDDCLMAMDADKVEKIIVNLLSNAFKHTPNGGSVAVRLTIVEAEEKKLKPYFEKYVEITVEDTGEGINQDQLDRIFEKYYTSKSEVVDGAHSGIGLSYIRDLTYLMQGEILVESQPQKGTSFKVYLPYVKVDEPSAEPVKPELKVARQEASMLLNDLMVSKEQPNQARQLAEVIPRILLVEDNPDMLDFLRSILQRKYELLSASNGNEGLKVAKGQNLDLIISDVMMPEMDGYTFCNKVKTNFATSHIPIILLTAKLLEEDRFTGFEQGADDYITKPFNAELLLVRVENLLQQRKQLREIFHKEFMLSPRSEETLSPDDELLQKLLEIMEENLSDASFNVDKMCKMVHLSHMHFIRKVKQLTGKKPFDLLKSFRMKKAKDLLSQQSLTVSEVAYRVGFDLPNSFSRAFKKEFNITPTQFMAKAQKEGEASVS